VLRVVNEDEDEERPGPGEGQRREAHDFLGGIGASTDVGAGVLVEGVIVGRMSL